MNWRKLLLNLIVIVILFIITYLIYGFLSGMARAPEEKKKEEIRLFVKTEKVKYSTINAKIIETGRLSSQQLVDLSAEVQGQILQGDVILKEGTKFREGTLLVKIFDEEARNNLKASKSKFMNGIATILPDIRIDFPESYKKYESFFTSIRIDEPLPELPKLDSEKEKIFLSSRNILNDYFNIKSAEIRLTKYRLYAPFNGTFTAVYLEPGSVANPGNRIATLIRTDKLELEVPVRVEDIYWINVGDEVVISTKEMDVFWKGIVARKSDFMDPSTQAINVYISIFSEKNKTLYPGQYLKAEFASKTIDQGMEIPRNAIFNKDRVFIIADGKLKENRVEILKTNETTAIINGLSEGADLVIEPLVNAKEGFNAEMIR